MQIVRMETPEQQADCLELFRLGSEETRQAIMKPFDEGFAKEVIRRYVSPDRDNLACFLAYTDDGECCGGICGYLTRSILSGRTMAFDDSFYVKRKWRGSSAAVRSLTAFERWAIANGADQVAVGVLSGIANERVGRFLEHIGYKAGGVQYIKVVSEDGG